MNATAEERDALPDVLIALAVHYATPDGGTSPHGRALMAAVLRQAGAVPIHESLDVPSTLQDSPWRCGPAALQAALAFHGQEHDEADLARALGSTPQAGTCPGALVDQIRAMGLDCTEGEGLSLGGLEPENFLESRTWALPAGDGVMNKNPLNVCLWRPS